ncbi:hypothetical protein CNMCM6936_004332 [Aspergillus lentulus]|nr:hypothetical protein CNMCM6936_004332 [Aspergillus lentulus]
MASNTALSQTIRSLTLSKIRELAETAQHLSVALTCLPAGTKERYPGASKDVTISHIERWLDQARYGSSIPWKMMEGNPKAKDDSDDEDFLIVEARQKQCLQQLCDQFEAVVFQPREANEQEIHAFLEDLFLGDEGKRALSKLRSLVKDRCETIWKTEEPFNPISLSNCIKAPSPGSAPGTAASAAFFTSSFGQPAFCFGRDHVDLILATYEKVQNALFNTDSRASAVTEHLRHMIGERFGVSGIPDAFFFRSNWAVSLINKYKENKKQAYLDAKEEFEELIERERLQRYQVVFPEGESGATPVLDRSELSTFMAFEEYTRIRESTDTLLQVLYTKLMDVPGESDIKLTEKSTLYAQIAA